MTVTGLITFIGCELTLVTPSSRSLGAARRPHRGFRRGPRLWTL